MRRPHTRDGPAEPPAIVFAEGQVIVAIPKAVLVLSRAQFIDALHRGNAYRRRQALARRGLPWGGAREEATHVG